jgi:hypothetical protein
MWNNCFTDFYNVHITLLKIPITFKRIFNSEQNSQIMNQVKKQFLPGLFSSTRALADIPRG